jgi:hypothetical protein
MGASATSVQTRSQRRLAAEVRLLVFNERWTGYVSLFTRDVSGGGAFFASGERGYPEAGSPVVVRTATQSIVGHVTHVVPAEVAFPLRTAAGFGVAFLKPQPEGWWASQPTRADGTLPRASTSTTLPELILEPARALFDAGLELFSQRGYHAAARKFAQAWALAPEPSFLAMQIVCGGYQYLDGGLMGRAKVAFERALQIAPECEPALRGLELLQHRSARPS